ncbi:MAG TPA: hypothetical protein VFQ61_32620 [Polyangiaceae bacterium]|nr:hypothetical protein [Polyangiaceae bacterium]
MLTSPDFSSLSPVAQKILNPDAPAPLRLMAARGALPGVKPHELVCVVALLTDSPDEKAREAATATLGKLPQALLDGALNAELPALVVDKLARAYLNQHAVLERLLRQKSVDVSTLEQLASAADERSGEIIATNEELMLANPTVIEKLYMNKQVRMSTADRLLELAVRNGVEVAISAYKEIAQAIKNELIAEASPEPTYDDIVFHDTEQTAERAGPLATDEDTHEVDDEGAEKLRERFVPLYAIIGTLSVTQKIRRAMLGTAAERLLLVRDSNRLVATAAVKSPLMRENEATQISASRSVSEDVLRAIAQNREFVRHYQVKLNLVANPRTPFTFAARLMPHLRDNDVRSLAKSKNVSGAIALAAKQQLLRKQGKS